MPRRRRGKRHHHGGDVCGIVVVGLKDFSVLFLPQESYGAGVFVPARTLITQQEAYDLINKFSFLGDSYF